MCKFRAATINERSAIKEEDKLGYMEDYHDCGRFYYSSCLHSRCCGCHYCPGACLWWLLIPIILGTILVPCAYYLFYLPTALEMERLQSANEFIVYNNYTESNCYKSELIEKTYMGLTSCNDTILNIQNYRIGEQIECGSGIYKCLTTKQINCIEENIFLTNSVTQSTSWLSLNQRGFFGIKSIFNCRDISKINFSNTEYTYVCDFSNDNNSTVDFSHVKGDINVGCGTYCSIYIQRNQYGCDTVCDQAYNNQSMMINIGKCSSVDTLIGISLINGEIVETVKSNKQCEFNDESCKEVYNSNKNHNLITYYYDEDDPRGTKSTEKKEFGFRSAITMFVFGGLSLVIVIFEIVCCMGSIVFGNLNCIYVKPPQKPKPLKQIPQKYGNEVRRDIVSLKINNMEAQDVCTICSEDYKQANQIKILNCCHSYHRECIDAWINEGYNKCPICNVANI